MSEKYNTIWDKVSNDIKKEFDGKTVYNKFLKITIKCYGDEATHFHNTESPKMGSNHTYLAVIRLNCALKRWKLLSSSVF